MFKKMPFYFNTYPNDKYTVFYRRWNLRHRYILWLIERYGYDEGMPELDWIVSLSWKHSKIIPGLHFGEA